MSISQYNKKTSSVKLKLNGNSTFYKSGLSSAEVHSKMIIGSYKTSRVAHTFGNITLTKRVSSSVEVHLKVMGRSNKTFTVGQTTEKYSTLTK